MAVTQRGDSLDSDKKQGVFHSTPDTGRELHLVTTAPPFTDLNHHLQFKTISQPDPHYQSPEQFKDSREVDHHLFKALSAQLVPERLEAAGENWRQRAKELSTESPTTSITPTSTPPPCNTVPKEKLGHRHAATMQGTEGVTTLVMREEGEKSKRLKGLTTDTNTATLSVSGDHDDETTTTTIFTTTIITTIQTPGKTICTTTSQQNLTNMTKINQMFCNISAKKKKAKEQETEFLFPLSPHHSVARMLLALF